jgi:hypothetical protein
LVFFRLRNIHIFIPRAFSKSSFDPFPESRARHFPGIERSEFSNREVYSKVRSHLQIWQNIRQDRSNADSFPVIPSAILAHNAKSQNYLFGKDISD